MAMSALALFVAACFSSILFDREACTKIKEKGIAMDFLVHYIEPIKALAFTNINYGQAINPTYDGGGRKYDDKGNQFSFPEIQIPPNTSPVALNTTNFETFCPDLLWLHNLNPELQVTIDTHDDATGKPHDKHLNATVTWDSPLGRAGRMRAELDMVRTKDL